MCRLGVNVMAGPLGGHAQAPENNGSYRLRER